MGNNPPEFRFQVVTGGGKNARWGVFLSVCLWVLLLCVLWRDPHYPEWAMTEAAGSGEWVGKVKRHREAPAQAMTMDMTTETLWTSEACRAEDEALRLARERIERGGPWES